MKRFLFALTLFVFACGVSADKFNVGELAYETTSGNTCKVLGYADGISPAEDSLMIPAVVEYEGNQYKVTSIGNSAFRDQVFSSVSIPENVTQIEDFAFSDCRELNSLNLPKTLIAIGDYAFMQSVSGRGKLDSIIIPESVKTIGMAAFSCTNLKKVEILGNAEVGDFAFSVCSQLKDVFSEAKAIGYRAFVFCDSLSGVALRYVKNIGDEAFLGCPNVNYISCMGDSMQFGKDVFKNSKVQKLLFPYCKNYKPGPVNFGGEVSSLYIGNVSGWTEDEIANKIKEFKSVDGWKDIPIYSGLELRNTVGDKFSVGELAYETTLDNTCRVLGYADNAIHTEDSLVIPPVMEYNGKQYKVTSIGKSAFRGQVFSGVSIPENVTQIEDFAFSDCRELNSLNLPKTLIAIGDYAFMQSVSGRGKLDSIIIPESVKTIGMSAFTCTNLRKVNILGNAEVGAVAFAGCDRLKRVEVYATTIGERAFAYCDSLSQILICKASRIDDEAFYRCHHINFITIQNCDSIYVGKETFKDCTVRKILWVHSGFPNAIDFSSNIKSLYLGSQVYVTPEEIENEIKEFKSIDGWKDIPIYLFSDLMTAYSNLSNTINRVETYTFGDKLGQYHMSERAKEFFARGKETLDSYYEGADEMKEIVDALLPDSLINIPTHSKFLRIKNNEGKYLTSNNVEDDSRVAFSEMRDDATIFYYDGGMYEDGTNTFGQLLSYKTAFYLVNKKGMLVNQTSVPESAMPNGMPCQLHGSYKSAGKYLIGFESNAYLRADASMENVVPSTVNDSLLAYDYTLEEVDTIPVTISQYGLSTFYSPVALEIPEGLTAYVCALSKSGNSIVLTSLNGMIPAHTGVLLEGEPNRTYGFAVSSSDETNWSCLAGNLPNTSNTQRAYTLQVVDGKLGFYKYTGGTLHGFRAYLNVSSSSRGFNLVKNDDDISGITGVAEMSDCETFFDLSGNKVVSPQKNQIYIHNGRKQLFK